MLAHPVYNMAMYLIHFGGIVVVSVLTLIARVRDTVRYD